MLNIIIILLLNLNGGDFVTNIKINTKIECVYVVTFNSVC